MTAKYQTAMDNSLLANIQSEIDFDPQIKSTDIHVAALSRRGWASRVTGKAGESRP